MKKQSILCSLFFSFLIVIPLNTQAATWYIDNASTCTASCGTTWATAFNSIQSAVNNAAAEDEIWVSGTFALTAQIDVDISVYIYGGFDGTETMLGQRDPETNVTTVDGQNSVRCFYLTDNATLDGLTITKGISDNSVTSDYAGGGILSTASLNLFNCNVSANQSVYPALSLVEVQGGAIYFNGDTLRIDNCTFKDNRKEIYIDGHGGAIYIDNSTAIIRNSTFSDNNAGDFYGAGGGIYAQYGNTNIYNCYFSGNYATDGGGGGGIRSGGGELLIDNCTFVDNGADYDGGGISGGNLIVKNSSFLGNSANWGGGGIFGGNLIVENSSFLGNSANWGSGIYAWSQSNNIISNSLFNNNNSYNGSGISFGGYYGNDCSGTTNSVINCTFFDDNNEGSIISVAVDNCTIDITNCILWGDIPYKIAFEHTATANVTYCNIDQDGYAGSNGNIRQDPLFVDSTNGNYRLDNGSPCIDSGTSDNAPTTDIEGSFRYDDPNIPNTGGGTLPYYDMGAYERQTPTLIELSSFIASPQSGNVIINWTTTSEIDNAGFNIYRVEGEGEFELINADLIPATGSPTEGAQYEFVDDDVQNRTTYRYMLEDVDLNGNATRHEAVFVTPRFINR